MSHRLLIVEDDEDIRSQMRWALAEAYDVQIAGDRAAAIELVRTHNPEVVVLDLGLPPAPGEVTEGLAALAAALDEEGHEVFLYGTQKDDAVPAEEIREIIRTSYPGRTVPDYQPPVSVPHLFELCSSADLLVTTRFHGAVFGVMSRRAVVAICYQSKTREVMEAAGLGEYAFEVEEVSLSKLRPVVAELQARRLEIWDLLSEHSAKVRSSLTTQDGALAALAGVPEPARRLQLAEV